jgi:hypothetical protein
MIEIRKLIFRKVVYVDLKINFYNRNDKNYSISL